MRKKIWALGICVALIFTGCGMPDAVADELKIVSRTAGFSDGDADSAAKFQKAHDEQETYMEKVKQSDRMAGYLDALAAYLEKEVTEGRIIIGDCVGDDEEYLEDYGESDMDANTVPSQTIAINPEQNLDEFKNWRDLIMESQLFMGYEFSLNADFSVEKDHMPDFLQGLEEIGFTGITVPEHSYFDTISQGVRFDILNQPGYYYIQIQVSSYNLAYPDKYADFLEEHMRNAFSITQIMCGGDLEYIAFQGGAGLMEDYYRMNAWNNRNVEIYFKDGKVLQMNLMFKLNSSEGGELFTEEERKDLIGLFAWVTGDEQGSESLINGLKENTEKEGTLGNRNWYQSRDGISGEVLVRIQ